MYAQLAFHFLVSAVLANIYFKFGKLDLSTSNDGHDIAENLIYSSY